MQRPIGKLRETIANVQSDFAVLALVGILVGVGSGLAGIGLHFGLDVIHPRVEASRQSASYGAILFPAVGALMSWFLLNRLAHYKGRGIADVIWSAYREGGHMPKKSMFTQMLSSWLTIGSGGSAGPEGPIAFTGAAIGSNIGSLFRLSELRRTTLLCCGVAGAISAIFNAPVTGMFFAIELIMGEWVSTQILPIALSSVVANLLTSHILQDAPIFHVEGYSTGILDLVLCSGLAMSAGIGSLLLRKSIEFNEVFFHKLFLPPFAKPFLGGLAVGALGLFLPDVLYEGYQFVDRSFQGEMSGGLVLLFVLLIAKTWATGLTLGSGGCGGIFAPALFIGAGIGLLYHGIVIGIVPGLEPHMAKPGAYALLGMAAFIGATLHAPVTAIFLVAEVTGSKITGSGDMLAPLILVTAFSTLLSIHLKRISFYQVELEHLGGREKINLDSRILADIELDELVTPVDKILEEDQVVPSAHAEILDCDKDVYPVVDASGRYVGMVRSIHLLGIDPTASQLMLVSDLMDASWPMCRRGATPAALFTIFDFSDAHVVPYVEEDGQLIGLIRADRFLRRYHQELLIQTTN